MTLDDSAGSESPASDGRNICRVVLIDEHQIVREAVRHLIDASDECDVVAEAGNASEALRLIESLQPAVVVTDFRLPDRMGMYFIAELHSRFPQVAILVLTALQTPEYVVTAVHAGARGYVLKDCRGTELLRALHEVAAGRQYLCKSLSDSARRVFGAEDKGRTGLGATDLTERQRQVLRSVALGYRNKEIAQLLGVSVKAVQKHREHLRDALELRSTAALTLFAVREGLVSESRHPRPGE